MKNKEYWEAVDSFKNIDPLNMKGQLRLFWYEIFDRLLAEEIKHTINDKCVKHITENTA